MPLRIKRFDYRDFKSGYKDFSKNQDISGFSKIGIIQDFGKIFRDNVENFRDRFSGKSG